MKYQVTKRNSALSRIHANRQSHEISSENSSLINSLQLSGLDHPISYRREIYTRKIDDNIAELHQLIPIAYTSQLIYGLLLYLLRDTQQPAEVGARIILQLCAVANLMGIGYYFQKIFLRDDYWKKPQHYISTIDAWKNDREANYWLYPHEYEMSPKFNIVEFRKRKDIVFGRADQPAILICKNKYTNLSKEGTIKVYSEFKISNINKYLFSFYKNMQPDFQSWHALFTQYRNLCLVNKAMYALVHKKALAISGSKPTLLGLPHELIQLIIDDIFTNSYLGQGQALRQFIEIQNYFKVHSKARIYQSQTGITIIRKNRFSDKKPPVRFSDFSDANGHLNRQKIWPYLLGYPLPRLSTDELQHQPFITSYAEALRLCTLLWLMMERGQQQSVMKIIDQHPWQAKQEIKKRDSSFKIDLTSTIAHQALFSALHAIMREKQQKNQSSIVTTADIAYAEKYLFENIELKELCLGLPLNEKFYTELLLLALRKRQYLDDITAKNVKSDIRNYVWKAFKMVKEHVEVVDVIRPKLEEQTQKNEAAEVRGLVGKEEEDRPLQQDVLSQFWQRKMAQQQQEKTLGIV